MTLIAIHLLQNHAPSNLNRNDNGDPKDSVFGGVRRARTSSQAIKRSIRWSEEFRNAFDDRLLGERTQLLPERVREHLARHNISDEEMDAILHHASHFGKADKQAAPGEAVPEAGDEAEGDQARGRRGRGARRGEQPAATDEEKKLKTKQLMFFTEDEVRTLTARLVEACQRHGATAFRALKTEEGVLNPLLKQSGEIEPHSVDIAMFGRMTTSSPFKDIDAAVQVAHAISTHKIEPEFDFYTAVDDLSGEAGAGFLSDTAYNSATYYKYFNIHWEGLLGNLHRDQELARTVVQMLLRAAMRAIPSGKQNSFAAHNLPDFALVEVLAKNVPLSYSNAFLKPVRAQDEQSLMDASVAALTRYAEVLPAKYNLEVERAFFATWPAYTLKGAQECAHTEALEAWLVERLPRIEAQR
jgi:CRISPR system Cascade subunit CasC